MSSKELRSIANKIGATTITEDQYKKYMKDFTSKYGLKIKDPGYSKMLKSADSNVLVRVDSGIFKGKDIGILAGGIESLKVTIDMGMRDDFMVIVYEYDFDILSGGRNGITTRFTLRNGKWEV